MIYALGSTTYDIIFKDGQPQRAVHGGTIFNSAVSLGRVGAPVAFVSAIGDDQVAQMFLDFCKQNEISTEFVTLVENTQSRISLAILDSGNNATYEFYGEVPFRSIASATIQFNSDDILLIGGSAAQPCFQNIQKHLLGFPGLLYYDPNPRKRFSLEIHDFYFQLAQIVKFSDDDIKNYFCDLDLQQLSGCYQDKIFIKTCKDCVQLFRGSLHLVVSCEPIDIVSSIGAGDSFNAGFIYRLQKIGFGQLTEAQLKECCTTGVTFAQNCCQSYENYVDCDLVVE